MCSCVLCVDSEGEQQAHHEVHDTGKDYYDSVDDGQHFDTYVSVNVELTLTYYIAFFC